MGVCGCCGFEYQDLAWFWYTKDYLCEDCFFWAHEQIEGIKAKQRGRDEKKRL